MKILETERLILRTWKDTYIDPMTAIDQDPIVCEYLPAIGDRATTTARMHCIIKQKQSI